MHREIHCSHMAKLVEMKIQIKKLLVLSRKQTRITRCTAVMRHTLVLFRSNEMQQTTHASSDRINHAVQSTPIPHGSLA
jgi:hypothetical protein